DVAETVSGLQPDTTYHYRLVASDLDQTSYGEDRTFKTPRWGMQSLYEPAGSDEGGLASVSCVSATQCMAVGTYKNNFGGEVQTRPLAMLRVNETWSLKTPPAFPSGGKGGALAGVSCTSATECTAVGYYLDSSGVQRPLVERWNGAAWAIQTAPLPSGATSGRFRSVSCISSSACTAVGEYRNAAGATATLAAQWNGTAWTPESPPNRGTTDRLRDVSCASASMCWAVGEYAPTLKEYGEGKKEEAVALRWDGAAWTSGTLPEAPWRLNSISCPTTSFCSAVGEDSTVERWSGGSWVRETMPGPGSPFAISCQQSLVYICYAVGSYLTSDGDHIAPMAKYWSGGGAWTEVGATDPFGLVSGATYSTFNDVSCRTLVDCTAVGTVHTPTPRVFAEVND
ncbi:MAG TPA: hypothetical protein VFR75_06445, partial [Solirubrobacterales bacterium]|nr:hypothetical protein [Solirubrobacterales bacterium]